MLPRLALLLSLALAPGCARHAGTGPPPGGWANQAPTQVVQVVPRDGAQLLEVRQGDLQTWVQVPDVGAVPGDWVLLGQGAARQGVAIPEAGATAAVVVDIAHAAVVSAETAQRVVAAGAPADAVPVGTVYAELAQRADQDIVVYGTVVKATSAVGAIWVHLRDGTGDAAAGTHDLTVRTDQRVVVGQRVAFRGVLRADVDLGFGYHYAALVEDGVLVQ